jgi:regulator of protease activity HflC (stomatin/prohibitin superfamily)
VAVSILRMSMPVQYTVRRDSEGFFNYLYNYSDPQEMLRDIAYRELVKQAVHFDYKKIMGEQRREVAEILERLIQQKCNEMELGVEIVFVGLQDVHPPTESEVAATFQDVATAEQQRDTLIQMARIGAARELVAVAGDVERAEKISALILKKGELGTGAEQEREIVDREIQQYMLGDSEAGITPIQGQAGELLHKARADAQDSVNRAAAKANTFQLERIAYEASPRLYKMRKVLETLSEKLDDVRKYVVVVDAEKTNLTIQLDEQESAGLEIIESPQ